jgi:uroporphyrin-III C-methyltransferase
MSDDGVEQRPRRTDVQAGPRRGGRGLAGFAVLLALAAIGLAGYPYYQSMFGATATETSLDAVRRAQERDSAALRRALNDAVAALDDRLQQQQIRQSARLDEQDARIEASTQTRSESVTAAASAARLANSLRLIEAEHLLQGANRRLLLQGDASGALAMMLAAQQVLEQVEQPAVLGVRAKLNDEITALRSDPGIDVNAAFVRLESLKQNLPEPPSGYEPTNLATPAVEVPISMWRQTLQKLASLFEFRRNGGGGRAPLTLDEVAHLRLNLELLLQTAQLALLRNDGTVYGRSLTTARAWLDDYRVNNGDAVASAQAEIDQLLALPLHRTLPDLSGSLTELRGLAAATAQAKSAPAAAAAGPAAVPAADTNTAVDAEAPAPAEPSGAPQ